MSTYRRVLRFVRAGNTPEEIAEELDRREDAIRGMLETMHRHGHVRRIDCEEGACSACPMADSCGLPTDALTQYVVSADGQAFLNTSEQPTERR